MLGPSSYIFNWFVLIGVKDLLNFSRRLFILLVHFVFFNGFVFFFFFYLLKFNFRLIVENIVIFASLFGLYYCIKAS